MPIREEFPIAGTNYMDGESDGWEYRVVFSGSSLEQSYAMVTAFLEEEGYSDIPLPEDAAELAMFRLPTRNKQILLFEDNGYVHNPVKILFPTNRRNKKTLILCLYNEQIKGHLTRFHRIKERTEGAYEIAKPKKKKSKPTKSDKPTENPNPILEGFDLDEIRFETAFTENEHFGE